jgi:NADH-quinone oxidoreductase subunit J
MYFFFFLFAIIGVVSAIMVITRKNVMHAAFFLLLTFAAVGAMYVTLRAEFLAAVQVLVYAGAVTVLFLFAILLINIPREMLVYQWTRQSAVAVVVAGLTGIWMIIAMVKAFGTSELRPDLGQPLGTPKAVAQLLFSEYALPFEIASLVLLAAVIGAIFLARETALDEEQVPPEADASTRTHISSTDRQPV